MDQNQASSSDATQVSAGSLSRVKTYIDYKRSKGKEWKDSVSQKGKGKKCQRDAKSAETDQEVIIFIGLMEWNEKSDCLKKKHGKRLALKVNKKDPPAALLEKASQKWKAVFSHCYNEDCYKEFFTVERYHE